MRFPPTRLVSRLGARHRVVDVAGPMSGMHKRHTDRAEGQTALDERREVSVLFPCGGCGDVLLLSGRKPQLT